MSHNDPTNAYTKSQIKDWLDRAIYKSRNPDPREKMKKIHQEKAKKVIKSYGFS